MVDLSNFGSIQTTEVKDMSSLGTSCRNRKMYWNTQILSVFGDKWVSNHMCIGVIDFYWLVGKRWDKKRQLAESLPLFFFILAQCHLDVLSLYILIPFLYLKELFFELREKCEYLFYGFSLWNYYKTVLGIICAFSNYLY